MTLKQEELIEALHDGLKAAHTCGNFCRSGAEVDEDRYLIHHNGVGARDTDSQVVHSTPVLALSKNLLSARLAVWIEKLHKGERQDLNASMELRGPAMAGWPWTAEFWCATCPPDPATGAGHWHASSWLWTDGTSP